MPICQRVDLHFLCARLFAVVVLALALSRSLGVSVFFHLFAKKDRIRSLAMGAMGLGMNFFGLEMMKNGFKPPGWPTILPGVVGPHELWHVAVLTALTLHWSFILQHAYLRID